MHRSCTLHKALKPEPRRIAAAALGVLGILAVLLPLPGGRAMGQSAFSNIGSAVQTKNDDQLAGAVPTIGAQLPLNTPFRNSRGQAVTLGQYFQPGRPVILCFIYFNCPGVCGYVLKGVAHAIDHMSLTAGVDYDVVTVSFDPRDKPPAAADKRQAYEALLKRKGAIAHWHFLTGREPAIQKLTAAAGFHYIWYPALGRFDHSALIYICTPRGKISQYLDGVQYDPATVRLSLVAAGDDRLGTVLDQLLLLCCSYDPNKGKYTAIALRVMAVAGVAVILGLGTIIGSLFVWEYRHRHPAAPRLAGAGPLDSDKKE